LTLSEIHAKHESLPLSTGLIVQNRHPQGVSLQENDFAQETMLPAFDVIKLFTEEWQRQNFEFFENSKFLNKNEQTAKRAVPTADGS